MDCFYATQGLIYWTLEIREGFLKKNVSDEGERMPFLSKCFVGYLLAHSPRLNAQLFYLFRKPDWRDIPFFLCENGQNISGKALTLDVFVDLKL